MKPQPTPPKSYSEIEVVRLVWLAIFISVFSFLYYNRNNDVLLYGDAVAHINIARRVFDSKTPGLLQLGTVWLPLQHLLILPFVVSNRMWQSGVGGSIPSMAAYVLAALGIFRLVRSTLRRDGENGLAQVCAWAAAILFLGNPNLIYMQATAMGESLYLAFFIWAVVYFIEFAQGGEKASRSLIRCGFCLFAACLTRYDGWFLAALMAIGAAVVFWRLSKHVGEELKPRFPISLRALITFVLLAASGPALWLAYNAAIYRNPLEFANGPYSAWAIAQRTGTVNPAKQNLVASSAYFLKAAELNVSESNWLGRLCLGLAAIGSLAAAFGERGRVALCLWAPLPFYALSVAYGSVPIFLPTWWPFSYYNVRYGLQLLPAYREAAINSRGRIALERQVAGWIKPLPSNSTLLMYLGEHVGILEQEAIPLRRVINEGNHRVWKQPADPEGLWEHALADPARYADYAIGFEGDPVWNTARAHHLTALVEIHTTGQPPAVVFRAKAPARSPE